MSESLGMLKEPLEKIVSLLEGIDKKLDFIGASVSRNIEQTPREEIRPIDVHEVLNLQGHLQKTALTLMGLEKASADEVSAKTGRGRAVESLYLNQLVQLGYAKKERVGRVVYFSVAK